MASPMMMGMVFGFAGAFHLQPARSVPGNSIAFPSAALGSRIMRVKDRLHALRMTEVENGTPAEEGGGVENDATSPPPIDPNAPTMPVSSTVDKIKGLGVIAVVLFASGVVLNYAFSPGSIFLASDEPKVNEGLVKYTTILEKAASQ